jgi:hypothetical protein
MLGRIRPAAGSWQSNGEKFNERLYAMFRDPLPVPRPLTMTERINRVRIIIVCFSLEVDGG